MHEEGEGRKELLMPLEKNSKSGPGYSLKAREA